MADRQKKPCSREWVQPIYMDNIHRYDRSNNSNNGWLTMEDITAMIDVNRNAFDPFGINAAFLECVKVQAHTAARAPRARTVTCCQLQAGAGRREALGLAAAAALAAVLAPSAKADLTADLLAKSAANKALNDKKRLATSYSNFQRSRTVQDGTCAFPENVLGCDVGKVAGDVAFIADDVKLECEGKEAGKCVSNMSIPQRNY